MQIFGEGESQQWAEDWNHAALLWQKEASDKSPKSEKVILLDWI